MPSENTPASPNRIRFLDMEHLLFTSSIVRTHREIATCGFS
jgi:hypothetical protein